MTRSKLIAMLQTSAMSLNALGSKAPTPTQAADPADSQVSSTVLQLILQILEGVLAEQPAAGQKAADLQQENTALMHALTDTLAGIHVQMAKASTGTVNIGGVQVNILQIIIQIMQSVLSQTASAPVAASADKPCPCSKETGAITAKAIEPRVTGDSVIYAYDNLGRLHELTFANGTTVVFNYDSVGNRSSEVITCSGSGC